MATYTYKCNNCGVMFEVVQKMTDDKLKDCNECDKENTLERVITPAGGFRIYGGGVHKPTSKIG